MRIKEILRQYRRDMRVLFECEHCGFQEEGNGYDDRNFHENIVPQIECSKCGRKASENFRPLQTKYPEGMQV